jgi:hypothetical protein
MHRMRLRVLLASMALASCQAGQVGARPSSTPSPAAPQATPSPHAPCGPTDISLQADPRATPVLHPAPTPRRPVPSPSLHATPSAAALVTSAFIFRVRLTAVKPCHFSDRVVMALLDSRGSALPVLGNPSAPDVDGEVGPKTPALEMQWTWTGPCTPSGSYQFRVFTGSQSGSGGGSAPRCTADSTPSRLQPGMASP